MRLAAVFLVIQVALAQHPGGFARTNPGVRGISGTGAAVRTHRAFERRSERRLNPYFSGFGDYGLWGGYPYGDNYLPGEYGEGPSSPPNVVFVPSAPPQAGPSRPVQAVVHEYSVAPGSGDNGAGASTIIIALKNGSQRSAVATWVQGGKLHYLDADGTQQTLSADLIDRHETNRLNRLQIQLPPG